MVVIRDKERGPYVGLVRIDFPLPIEKTPVNCQLQSVVWQTRRMFISAR